MIRNYILAFLLSLLPAVLIVYFLKPTYEEAIDNKLRKSRELLIRGELDSAMWEIQNVRHYEFHYDATVKLMDSIELLRDELYVEELKIEINKRIEELENSITVDWNEYPLGGFYISIIKTTSYGNIISSAIDNLKLDSSYASKIKSLGINFQEREFPIMRKVYSRKVDSLIANENIKVETNGAFNRELIFISNKFTETKNWEYLGCSSIEFEVLRFDRVIFKRIDEGVIVNNVELESKPDSVFGNTYFCGWATGFILGNRRSN